MKVSKRARRDAKQLFRQCFAEGLLNEERVRKVVQQLVAIKPRGYLGILTHFERLVKSDVERRSAHVESPTPLPPDLQNQLTAGLSRLYGPGLNFAFTQKPELLGGLRIQVGSDVYDDTVRARLNALADGF